MPKTNLSRRVFIGLGLTTVAAVGAGWTLRSSASFDGSELSVSQAYEAARTGKIVLIDIRRPDEWKATGVAEGAHPIDMRRHDFVEALNALTEGQTAKPIALICARGVRSARLSNRLIESGYANIINVPEGMLGSRAGPGWLNSNLPVQEYAG